MSKKPGAVKAQKPPTRMSANRDNIRLSILPTEIRGFAERYGGGEQKPVMVWDITPQGLCLWSPHAMSPGDAVTVTLNSPGLEPLTATIVWCLPVSEKLGGYRSGLKVSGRPAGLHTLYERLSG
jgi:hypothetical protein